MQTEDHPLECGTFEGGTPKGEYGAGSVTIWDAGEYDLEKWRDGKEIIATLRGKRDGGLGGQRKYALIHTGGKAESHWLIHLMDRGKTVAPMLATLGSKADLDTGDDWAFEMKWDGVRAVIYVDGDGVRILSRNGNDLAQSYPDLAGPLADAVGATSAVLDSEIVALDSHSRPDFGLLQDRMGLTRKHDVDEAIGLVPVHLMLFDALEIDGESLRKKPYDERRSALHSLIAGPGKGVVQLPPAFDGDSDAALASSIELVHEGLVVKKRGSTYSAGRRSRAWIKIKHRRSQEVVIGGWRPGKGHRTGKVGSLLMGVPNDAGKLDYVGRVGTGIGESELEKLLPRLEKLARKTSPFLDVPNADASDAKWVTPKLVGEVEFAEWTTPGRLWQPSWRGLRADKSAEDVKKEDVKEEDVKEEE